MTNSIVRRDFLKLMGATGAAAALPFDASFAAAWPTRPISTFVVNPPGDGVDLVLRSILPLAQPKLENATINVVNKPGGTGSIATQFVWTQPSDGYSWLACAAFNRGLRVAGLHETVPYRDWQFYGADTSIMSFSVLPDSPIKDMGDLIDRGRKEPDKLRMSSNGPGGTWYLGAVLLMKETKSKFRLVPYKGGLPATTACLDGEVEIACSGLHEQLPSIKAGKLRNLAVATSEPMSVQGHTLAPVTKWAPSLASHTPVGGGMTLGLKRDTDPGILKAVAGAWKAAIQSEEFGKISASKVRFPDPVVGEAADRRAANWECVAANLLAEVGLAKKDLKSLDIPPIEEFDKWWPPKGYKPAI